MEPNKRDYAFLAGGEVEVRKEGKLVYRPVSEQPSTVTASDMKRKKPRYAKPQEKVVPKLYMNLSLKVGSTDYAEQKQSKQIKELVGLI